MILAKGSSDFITNALPSESCKGKPAIESPFLITWNGASICVPVCEPNDNLEIIGSPVSLWVSDITWTNGSPGYVSMSGLMVLVMSMYLTKYFILTISVVRRKIISIINISMIAKKAMICEKLL